MSVSDIAAEAMVESQVASEASADVAMMEEEVEEKAEVKVEGEVKGEGEEKAEEKMDEQVQGEEGEGTKKAEEKEWTMKDLGWVMRQVEAWQRQCSKHLSHIERRAMESEFLGHEVVRQFVELISGFSPFPAGDWGWLLRKGYDISVRAMRQLTTLYGEGPEDCMKLVRLYFEEAFVRSLGSYEEPALKRALCAMVVSMHNLEGNTMRLALVPPELRLLSNLHEKNVMALARVVHEGKANLTQLPSFTEAMSVKGMKHEVFSLMPFGHEAEGIAMTKAEIKQVIEATGGEVTPEMEKQIEGKEGVSMFEELFA